MARNHGLSDLARTADPTPLKALDSESRVSSSPVTHGPVNAVTRSLAHLKAHTIIELDPGLIEPSFISDRMDHPIESITEMALMIQNQGQQVPILVRPHPALEGHYQAAYGHRRYKAAALLGRKVKAMIKPLTDTELVIAQGVENTARKDLCFIERARFAARLKEADFANEIIMAALSIDNTTLSRLLTSIAKIPSDIIDAIGPAQKAGRDRWIVLAAQMETNKSIAAAREILGADESHQLTPDERFERVFAAVSIKRRKSATTETWAADDGRGAAQIKFDKKSVTIIVSNKKNEGFGQYVAQALPDLYAAFKGRREA